MQLWGRTGLIRICTIMKRFKNILCVVEPSQESVSAFERACLLAQRNDAELRVVGVIESLPVGTKGQAGFPSTDVRELILDEAKAEVEQLVGVADTHGVPVQSDLLAGTPFVQIIREVLRERHDLVVLTAEGGTERRRWLFGSTSMHLMRKCPCPVWVMKPGQSRFQRIMACVDPDPELVDPQKRALDEKVLELAGSLAKRESAQLHIVHAWHLVGEQMLRRRSPADSIEQWAKQAQNAHSNELDELLKHVELDDIACEKHLIKGMPREVLSSFTADHEIDLVVMGTVCRTGIAGFFIGNTAEFVLQQVDSSVLAVKPDGFVSPITV